MIFDPFRALTPTKAFLEELKEANSEAAMLRGQLAVYEKMAKK